MIYLTNFGFFHYINIISLHVLNMSVVRNPKKIIIDTIGEHPEGLTFTSLAEHVGLHRHTITKYIYELMGAGVIEQRNVGMAKLCYLRGDYAQKTRRRIKMYPIIGEDPKEPLQKINSRGITVVQPKLSEKIKEFVLRFEKIKEKFD